MSRYLTEVTENYRVDSEAESKQLIEEAKADDNYILKKYSSQFKERKQKGEVIDSWFKVTLVKSFTDEKEPEMSASVSYEVGGIFE